MALLLVNLISGIIMVLIFGALAIFDRKNMNSELRNIKLIVLSGILIAIAVVLNKIVDAFLKPIIPVYTEIKIGNFALVLIGFFCGGGLGFLSGIAADVISVMISSNGTPTLFFTLISIIWCIVPYYLVKLLSKIYYHKRAIYFYLPITYALILLLISAINPFVLKYLYGMNALWPLYLSRIIKYPFDVAIHSILLIVVSKIFINGTGLTTKIYQPSFEEPANNQVLFVDKKEKRKEVIND